MKNRSLLALIPAVLFGGLVIGIILGRNIGLSSQVSMTGKSTQSSKLRTVLQLIDAEYVDKIDIDSLIEKSLPDILASLDPHSVYIPAEEFHAANDDLEGSFSGVGIMFQILEDTVTVVEVVPGGPAEKVGLLAGDRILKADTTKMTGSEITNDKVFKTLRGKAGTKVNLDILRRGSDKVQKYDIVRGDVPVNSIDASYIITPGIGYVKVNKFAKQTYSEFVNSLSDLQAKGAGKFIIDLRGNSGGLLDQAILMVNEFLHKGEMIVYTKGRNPLNETVGVSDGSGNFQESELVVLTDETSASASEIFAGAIQDNDRGLVIGRRTFGKGLVQNQTMLPDSSAIRLTVARYYTPSGRCIQKEYTRGKDGKYEMDIVERYNHGEFYNPDSIKLDKTKVFHTAQGRVVYGGGGIMPDIFVPQDTTGYTSYYINVVNQGLPQKFSFNVTDNYRPLLKNVTTIDKLFQVVPSGETLLNNFVDFAATNGEPARWYYINQSRSLLLRQLEALIARDALGYQEFFQLINKDDPVIDKAIEELKSGRSPILIKK